MQCDGVVTTEEVPGSNPGRVLGDFQVYTIVCYKLLELLKLLKLVIRSRFGEINQ